MEITKLVSILESILFVSSDLVSLKELVKLINDEHEPCTAKTVRDALTMLQERYEQEISGLHLLNMEDAYQLVAKPQNNDFVEKVTVKKRKKTLSQAALEVISIIAYKQPITKIEIEEIRGVKSDRVISNLLELDLIAEKGRLDRIGRPILYGTTDTFLREFGIDKIKNLPKISVPEREDEE